MVKVSCFKMCFINNFDFDVRIWYEARGFWERGNLPGCWCWFQLFPSHWQFVLGDSPGTHTWSISLQGEEIVVRYTLGKPVEIQKTNTILKHKQKAFLRLSLYQDNSMYATWHFLVSVILYQIKYFHYNNKMWVPQNNIKPSHESLTVAVVWFWIGTQSKGYLGREFPKEATWSGKFLPLRTPIRASYRTEQLEASFNLGRKVERAEDKRLTSITTQSNFSTGHMQRLRGHHRGSQLNAKESWKWTYKSYKM